MRKSSNSASFFPEEVEIYESAWKETGIAYPL
jgi:hypothetical protein